MNSLFIKKNSFELMKYALVSFAYMIINNANKLIFLKNVFERNKIWMDKLLNTAMVPSNVTQTVDYAKNYESIAIRSNAKLYPEKINNKILILNFDFVYFNIFIISDLIFFFYFL